MLVADTSLLVAHLRAQRGATTFLRRRLGEGVVVPAIAAFELWSGASSPRMEEKVQALLEVLSVDPLVPAVARIAGETQRAEARRGRARPLVDILIAAHALHHHCAVATLDRDYDGIPGLDVVFLR